MTPLFTDGMYTIKNGVIYMTSSEGDEYMYRNGNTLIMLYEDEGESRAVLSDRYTEEEMRSALGY